MVAARVLLVDAADFFSATGDEPRFDVSDQAVLHMEDTAPTAIGTAGTPTVVAAPVRSLWQTDSIGIRMLARHQLGDASRRAYRLDRFRHLVIALRVRVNRSHPLPLSNRRILQWPTTNRTPTLP
jgi:hypothetical protein